MTVEMKKCKECGKLFVPRNPRQQYCDELHYRPCPVCGKPVEAKYLSDPARVCSNECKKILAQRKRDEKKNVKASEIVQPVEEVVEVLEVVKDEAKASVKVDLPKSGAIVDTQYEDMMKNSHKVKEYNGKDVCGFKNGHVYAVDIERPEYAYEVTAVYDFTDHESVDYMLPVSSKTSFYRYFKSVEI